MTYNEMINKILTKEPFSFSRFGDGEWNAIYQDKKSTQNCDGHFYYPEMGKRLKEVLMSSPDYFIGLQSLAHRQRPEQIDQMTEDYNLEWCEANIIHRANIKGRMQEFFDALKTRDVLIIGPQHMKEITQFEYYRCEIPNRNCWNDYDKIHSELKVLLPLKNWVVIYCASMMANVLIDDFKDAGVTQIDVGSALDPYCNVHSRSYHRTLKI